MALTPARSTGASGQVDGAPDPSHRSNLTAVAAFLVLAFGISWLAWAVTLALGGDPQGGMAPGAAWLLGGLGPPLAAVVLAATRGRGALRALLRGLVDWRAPGRWYGLVGLPLVVAVATVAIIGARPAPGASLATAALTIVPMFVVMAIIGGGMEELGWRGYALPRLQAAVGPLPASLAIGVVWALWHLPLYAMTNTTQADSHFGWFALGAVALSIILTWGYNATGGSVLFAVAFHAGVNTFYSAVVGHVELADFADFEMTAALLMTAVAVVVAWATGARLGVAHHEAT